MFFDIHVHTLPLVNTKRLSVKLRQLILLKIFQKNYKVDCSLQELNLTSLLNKRFLEFVSNSQIDRFVLLAIDRAHDRDGFLIGESYPADFDNDAIADLSERHGKLLFGASIHPYRHDAIIELERVVRRGGCLIKWIPSAQNIDPSDPLCIPFYEAMAHWRIPLLTHTGNEHTLHGFSNKLNNPLRLEIALRYGVKVICAHCGARMFLHERSFFGIWEKLARDYEHCYGDVSAFGLPFRVSLLKCLLKDKNLLNKIVYGSDFPAYWMPFLCLRYLGLKKLRSIYAEQNPLNRPFLILKQLGFPDEVFSRAENLLRFDKN